MDSYIQAILDFIHGLDLSPKDFVANGVFFILDIVLISALLPLLFRSFEDRKWRSSRSEIEDICVETSISIINITDAYCGTHMREMESLLEDRYDIIKRLDFETSYFKNMKDALECYRADYTSIVDNFCNRMQILSPAFNSNISIGVSCLIDSWERLMDSSVSLAERLTVDAVVDTERSDDNRGVDPMFGGFYYWDLFPRIIFYLNNNIQRYKGNDYNSTKIFNTKNNNIRRMAKTIGIHVPMGKDI